MQENTNNTLAINTVIIQIKMIITIIAGLLSSRWALSALGEADFGLFTVVGGLISFMAIINTTMLSSSNRFMAIAVGTNDINQINEIFNVNLIVHIFIAIVTLFIAIPLGYFYVDNYINYVGDIKVVFIVFYCTLIGSVFSFIGVPFNGFLIAKEKFFVFSLAEIVSSLMKCALCYLLFFIDNNRLLIYSLVVTILSIFPVFVYVFYCVLKFHNEVRISFVKDLSKYRSVLSFSVWTGFGAIASVGQSQGGALIVNMFFNTIMNTAMGVANTINNVLNQFVLSIVQPMMPQLTKSYVKGDHIRCNSLMIASSKYSFLVLLVITSPFLVRPSFFFDLWLGYTPQYSDLFLILMIVNTLIHSLSGVITTYVFSTGNIRIYQLVVNSIILCGVLFAYFVLKTGVPAYYYLLVIIGSTFLLLLVRLLLLKYLYGYSIGDFFLKAYIPCFIVSFFYIPIYFLSLYLDDIESIIFSFVYSLIVSLFIGLNSSERRALYSVELKIYLRFFK